MTEINSDGQGLRHNENKLRYDLLPPEFIEALVDHFTKNLEKYPERNWERGMDWLKCFASIMRHCWAWIRGEDFDQENGRHHMIAVAWNAMAIYIYYIRKIGKDDRIQAAFYKEPSQ